MARDAAPYQVSIQKGQSCNVMAHRTPLTLVVDTTAQAGALYAASLLMPFATDKLTGTGSSIEGFAQIGAAIGVDPTFFRYFVGVQEFAVSVGLAAAIVAFLQVPWLQGLGRLGVRLGAPGLVATMLGALATEFYVRPGQQDWLVALALRLLALGVPLTIWTVARFEWPWLRRAAR